MNAIVKKIIAKRQGPATHAYKEKIIMRYAKKNRCNVFIETGTYKGEMLTSVCDVFDYLASVEIVQKLYLDAKEKLSVYKKIHLYNGDSGVVIPQMLDDAIKEQKNPKFLFWLDGHYSGGVTGKGEKDTPIIEELNAIAEKKIGACVILIDDARCYTHEGIFIDYPTIDYLKKHVIDNWAGASFEVKKDIIRIVVR